jgi:two-component system, NarL family, response regulator LiaR
VINVIIIDDHPIVRAGMHSILDIADDIQVIAEGANGSDALRLTMEHHPDVLILDLNLPDISGLDVAQQISREGTSTAILVLTAQKDRQTVFGLLDCGVVGYVLKDEALETLANAVRAAARGESWLSPGVATQVVRAALGQGVKQAVSKPPDTLSSNESNFELTSRELDVLRLLAQGLDNAAIAASLVVTKRTVQNHVSNIYGKLGVASRTEAMLFAIQQGLVNVTKGGNFPDAISK